MQFVSCITERNSWKTALCNPEITSENQRLAGKAEPERFIQLQYANSWICENDRRYCDDENGRGLTEMANGHRIKGTAHLIKAAINRG